MKTSRIDIFNTYSLDKGLSEILCHIALQERQRMMQKYI